MDTNTHPLFVGYSTLEGWAEAVYATLPVYADQLRIPTGHYENGPTIYDCCVVVAQPDQQGIVHYCCLKKPAP